MIEHEKMGASLKSAKVYDGKFDILKFVLSFFVVAIHTSLFPMVLFPWLRCAVPLFFIMTGYFLFEKLKGIADDKSKWEIIKNFSLRNLKLYFFWFVCLLPIILWTRRDALFANGLFMSILALLKMILFGSSFTGSWYIMQSIFGALIVFLVSKKIPNKVLFLLSLVLYVCIVITSNFPNLLQHYEMIGKAFDVYSKYVGAPTLTFPIAVVWLICGKCFADGDFSLGRTSWIIIFVLSAGLLYTEWFYVGKISGTYRNDCYLFLLPFCVGVFGWICKMRPLSVQCSIHLKRASTVIYAMHGAINRIDGAFYRNILNIDSPLLCFLTTSTVCVLAYVLIAMLLRNTKSSVVRMLRFAY